MSLTKSPLVFEIIAECGTTKARVGKITLPHGPVDTPVFMPVGTQVRVVIFSKAPFWLFLSLQGTLKGMLPEQLKGMGLQIMLSNTYHLGTRPVSHNSLPNF